MYLNNYDVKGSEYVLGTKNDVRCIKSYAMKVKICKWMSYKLETTGERTTFGGTTCKTAASFMDTLSHESLQTCCLHLEELATESLWSQVSWGLLAPPLITDWLLELSIMALQRLDHLLQDSLFLWRLTTGLYYSACCPSSLSSCRINLWLTRGIPCDNIWLIRISWNSQKDCIAFSHSLNVSKCRTGLRTRFDLDCNLQIQIHVLKTFLIWSSTEYF